MSLTEKMSLAGPLLACPTEGPGGLVGGRGTRSRTRFFCATA